MLVRAVTPAQKGQRQQWQKEHMLAGSPISRHHRSHMAVLESARCSEAHGCGVSVQKEHWAHLHNAHCVLARAGVHSAQHAAWSASPEADETHLARGGGGDACISRSKPSQKAQPRQPHSCGRSCRQKFS